MCVKFLANQRTDAQGSSRMTENERIEGARRAKGALAYAGLTHRDVIAATNLSPATVGRILAGTRKETTWDDLWAIADLCSIPREWFSADLWRLHEIVPPGKPTFGSQPDLRAKMGRALAERVELVHRRSEAAAKGKRGRRRKAQ
jgi:hypothetical protein